MHLLKLTTLIGAAGLLLVLPVQAQFSPGSSGSTTTTTYTQTTSKTVTDTITFNRDQGFTVSGSNVTLTGALTVPGSPITPPSGADLGSLVPNSQLFPASTASISAGQGSLPFTTTVSVNDSSSASTGRVSQLTTSSSTSQSLTLNPNLGVSPASTNPFDFAVTQTVPGVASVSRSQTGQSTAQVQTSLTVFSTPFVP